MSAPPLHTVVYDVGNVLVDWNPRYLYSKLIADPAEMEWFLSEVCSPAWNLAQDGGRPWADAEVEAIARHPTQAALIRAYRARWHEMINATMPGAEALLEDLVAARVPLYAITNFAGDTFRETRARFPFFKHFRGISVSGDLKLLKPDRRIYEHLSNTSQLDLTRCVFIDDSPLNVRGAEAMGMTGIVFTSTDQGRAALRTLGFQIPSAAPPSS